MTSNEPEVFPVPEAKLETKAGKERLDRTTATFNAHVKNHKDQETYFLNNKRSIFAAR